MKEKRVYKFFLKNANIPRIRLRVTRRGFPPKTGTMDTDRMAKWIRFLGRRGVTVKRGGIVSWIKRRWYKAEALYDSKTRTIYIARNPTKSAFFEEAFHALQHLRNLPRFLNYQGWLIDRWEYEAQGALIRYRHKLGIPNEETRQTIQNFRNVLRGNY